MRVKLGEDLSQVFCGDVTIAVLNVFQRKSEDLSFSKFNHSQIMNLFKVEKKKNHLQYSITYMFGL